MWELRLIGFIVLMAVILILQYKGILTGDDDFGM